MTAYKTTILCDKTGDLEAFLNNIQILIEAGASSLLLLACEQNNFSPTMLDKTLQTLPIPVFGGIFPGIFSDNQSLQIGSIVCGYDLPVSVHYIQALSNPHANFQEPLEQCKTQFSSNAALLIFVDGSSKRIEPFLEETYYTLGAEHSYLGGGAGSVESSQKAVLFSNEGMREECAQITAIERSASVVIEHGWEKFAGPFLVTEAEGNRVISLDFKPAYQVYQQAIEEGSGLVSQNKPFFEIARHYPIGIDHLDCGLVVRDPVNRIDNELIFLGEVPENNLIHILKGKQDSLLAASANAAETLASTGTITDPVIFLDCISRSVFLKDRLHEELQGVTQALNGSHLIGALTLGEIAKSGGGCLEFYNKTAVLGALMDSKQ